MPVLIVIIPKGQFPLGQIVITSNAGAQLDTQAVNDGLQRHAAADWGDVCEDDRQLNDSALLEGDRLLSVYGTGEKRFWIITESDRSVTTVLMPEDY